MANARIAKRIIEDGYRNAMVELVYSLDTTGTFADNAAVILADFTNNEPAPQGAFNGFRVDNLHYSITAPVGAIFYWNSTADQPIFAVSGSEHMFIKEYLPGLQPNRAAAGYDGAIDVLLVNIPAGASATLLYIATFVLDMTKLYAAP